MPKQRYIDKDVLTAARERIAFIFDSFESIVVSVSGGKDSTVLAHLALTEAAKRGRKIGVHFLDEEVVYESSVKQVDYLMGLFPEHCNRLWLQVEFALTNATSTTEGQLIAWEAGKHKLWMRPKRDFAVKVRMWSAASQTIRNKAKGFGFYDAIENFERCYTDTAFLVGLRAAGESPNRWRAVTKNPIEVAGTRVYWATRKGANSVMYPIYDWNYTDVWRYIHDQRLEYSKVYDWQLIKGVSPASMRVSSLIHEKAFKSIVDLPEFEPKTYARLQKRVKGIALAQERGKDAKLFAARTLPKNFTSWMTYRDYLLGSHLDRDRLPIFRKRFAAQLDNEYVARQQVRQLLLNDYENNLAIDNKPDPREAWIRYYDENL